MNRIQIVLTDGTVVERKWSHVCEAEMLERGMRLAAPDEWVTLVRPTDTGVDFENMKKLASTSLSDHVVVQTMMKAREKFAAARGWVVDEDHHGKYWADEDGDWVADFEFDPLTHDLS